MGRLSIWHDWQPLAPAEAESYPNLVPLFGVAPHTPASPCPHHGLLPDGTRLVCMVCHRTGARTERRIAAVAAAERRAGANQVVADRKAGPAKFRPRGGRS